jgi:hypothetical protein
MFEVISMIADGWQANFSINTVNWRRQYEFGGKRAGRWQ